MRISARETAKKRQTKAAKIPKAGTPMSVTKTSVSRRGEKKSKPRKQFKTSVYVLSGE